MGRLRPSERLTLAFLGLLLGLALTVRPSGWGLEAAALGGLIAGTGLLSRTRGHAGDLLRDFAPVGIVLAIYLLLQPLLAAVNGHRWDAALARADLRLFGDLGAGWRGALGRPAGLTDFMYGVYASFYALPVGVAARARRRLGPEGFERIVFALLLGFYLSFLGYFLCPAEGPRVPQALEASRLGGGWISEAIRAFLRASERTTLDAFPSGHTALALLAALLATKPFPRLAPLLWAWSAAIVFATVYLSLHYLVDVVAGAALALAVLPAAGPVARAFGGSGARDPGRGRAPGPSQA